MQAVGKVSATSAYMPARRVVGVQGTRTSVFIVHGRAQSSAPAVRAIVPWNGCPANSRTVTFAGASTRHALGATSCGTPTKTRTGSVAATREERRPVARRDQRAALGRARGDRPANGAATFANFF